MWSVQLALNACQINRVDERQYVVSNHETLLSNKYLIGPFLIESDGVNELEYCSRERECERVGERVGKRAGNNLNFISTKVYKWTMDS